MEKGGKKEFFAVKGQMSELPIDAKKPPVHEVIDVDENDESKMIN